MSLKSLSTKNLSKKYDNKTVINKVTINLPSRGIFGVLGKNGAGKTTFLAMLMGLIKPTSGDISIFEKSLKYCKYEILKEINFQSPYVELPKKMTVEQNLLFYARLYEVENSKEKIRRLSEDLLVTQLLDSNYGTLSSGQKTRVNLCKALLNDPRLLLLDEPTASLDVSTSEFVRRYLIDFQKKNHSAIIITSHNLDEIEEMCSYIIVLDKGKVTFNGRKSSFFKNNKYSSLKEFFLNDK